MSAFLLWSVSFFAFAKIDCPADRIDEYAVVDTIYDGDTILLGDKRKLRFIGINTPERERSGSLAQPFSDQATRRLEQLIPQGSRVGLRYDKQSKDRYRRTLAHIFRHDGLNVTAELIKQGYGFAIVVPPNNWQLDCYFQVEQQARKRKAGIWSHAYYRASSPEQLNQNQSGFMRVTGKVTRKGQGKKNIWLDMGKHFSLKVSRKNVQYFTNMPIDDLVGKHITVRGWVTYYNNKLRMSLRHPAMLEIQE